MVLHIQEQKENNMEKEIETEMDLVDLDDTKIYEKTTIKPGDLE